MKTFKQYINETSIYVDDVEFDFGSHFLDRIPLRSDIKDPKKLLKILQHINENLDIDTFVNMIKKIRSKLKDLPEKGEFLFYDKNLKQGMIAAWDAFKNKLKFITFLPPDRHNVKPGTEMITLEQTQESIKIIHI